MPWADFQTKEEDGKKKAAWERCKTLARNSDILSAFVHALSKRGVVGESRAAKLLYLKLTSRVLDRPVSAVIVGPSAAGKSFIVEQTLAFFSSDAYHDLTAMSERALAYSTEPISHRFLVLYEGTALTGDFLNYIVRSLLSEGRLRYETVEKTAEGMKVRLIEREGPTGLIMTTTAVTLHPENETRHIAIPVSDSQLQTRRVLLALAKEADGTLSDNAEKSTQLEKWQALQDWIAVSNHRVVVPYARPLARLISPVAVRLRRDLKAILHLVKANAILHQVSRQTDKNGNIVAKLSDYRTVRKLVNHLISQGVEQTVSQTVRETVKAVKFLCQNGDSEETRRSELSDTGGVTISQLAKELHIDRSSATRRVKRCLVLGSLKNLETKRGFAHRLVVGDPLPGKTTLMPTTHELRGRWKNAQ